MQISFYRVVMNVEIFSEGKTFKDDLFQSRVGGRAFLLHANIFFWTHTFMGEIYNEWRGLGHW